MDPIARSLAAAVQAVFLQPDLPAPELAALVALVGQELDVIFTSQDGTSIKLQLPSGQTVTAQGELPYPEGTQLRVKVLDGSEGSIRLQPTEARPPAFSPLLAPLVQGEGQALMARLGQEEPVPALLPLLQLLRRFEGAEAAPGEAMPALRQVEGAVGHLPLEVRNALGVVLGLPSRSVPEMAEALETWLQVARTSLRESETAVGEGVERFQPELVRRFAVLVSAQPTLAAAQKDGLTQFIRSLLQVPASSGASERLQESSSVLPGPSSSSVPKAERGESSKGVHPATSEARVPETSFSRPDRPETWETWIKGSLKALSDPAASPKEAPFHALQAREGTGFFEIPLPWAPSSMLQIWVESEGGRASQGGRVETQRVLLGLKFSQLGETRLGMSLCGTALQVRVWAEHPGVLEASREGIEEELGTLGKSVDFRILPLACRPDGSVPSLRSLVAGSSLHALG